MISSTARSSAARLGATRQFGAQGASKASLLPAGAFPPTAGRGFDDDLSMTMTNKIKDVELVWTLGAMLAKSAELANGARPQAPRRSTLLASPAHRLGCNSLVVLSAFAKAGPPTYTKVGWP